jgi:uncharacterized protein YjaZ
VFIVVAAINACAPREPAVRFFRSDSYTFSAAERRGIQEVASATLREVRPLLRGLPRQVHLTVRPGTDVIAETGETGAAMPPDAIMWTVDPRRQGGVAAITKTWLRASLIHELHHLARAASQPLETLMDRVVDEGLATAFERDVSGLTPPWGAYPANVADWVTELSHLPPDSPNREWLYDHPDGRKWIGMKAGTYLVDEAMKRSGQSITDLAPLTTQEILALSRTEPSS